MNKREEGFSLIELLIAMTVFVLIIAASSSIFTGLLNQFKQQSKIAETSVEGIIGLEMLRRDLEHAGYGLPWVIPAGVTYQEAISGFNDSPNPPRAIVSGNDSGLNLSATAGGSDYLAIKSVNVARNDACERWTILKSTTPHNPRIWTNALGQPSLENLDNGDGSANPQVIVLALGSTTTAQRELIANGATFFTTYTSVTASPWQSTDPFETHIVYGVDQNPNLRMPFNRADYFIEVEPNEDVPDRCAPNTGVLVKATVNHDATGSLTNLPLFDCVADFQVIYGFDIDGDGQAGTNSNADGSLISSSEGATIATVQNTLLNAADLRNQLREIRVYILAHEGQRDRNYTFPNNTITVGEFGLGRVFDLSASPNFQNYRWRLYTLIVKPNNLR